MGVPCHGIPMKGSGRSLLPAQAHQQENIEIYPYRRSTGQTMWACSCHGSTGRPVVSTMMVPRVHPGYRFMDHVVTLVNKQAGLLAGKGVRGRRSQ